MKKGKQSKNLEDKRVKTAIQSMFNSDQDRASPFARAAFEAGERHQVTQKPAGGFKKNPFEKGMERALGRGNRVPGKRPRLRSGP